VIIGLERQVAARRIAGYWSGLERDHAARRDLAGDLVDLLKGKRSVMYEVAARRIPARSVLCLKENVDQQGAWAFGKEFVGILKDRPLPRIDGVAREAFCIYHGEASEDSDGPIEWCRPVPDDQAKELAAKFPELSLRSEPWHEEASVYLGPGTQIRPPQWHLVSEGLHSWVVQQDRQPSELGVRVTFLTTPPLTLTVCPTATLPSRCAEEGPESQRRSRPNTIPARRRPCRNGSLVCSPSVALGQLDPSHIVSRE
jgi:hypothetical protein